MDVITTVRVMQDWSDTARRRGQRIGFVPTMGYLHDGHLSLVTESQRRAAVTVASIFVNPLQFGANEDLARYPRDIASDTRLLTEAGTDVLFLPDVSEMYPEGFQTTVTVERVTQGLCGASRPTHFRGVTTVVAKLFNMVKPDVAVFGRKDYQQLVTIQRMVRDLNFGIEIVGAPIVREADGLAMSSRNAYLSAPERTAALCLSKALHAAQAAVDRGETDAGRILAAARALIGGEPLAQLDYATLVDPETLEDVSAVNGAAVLALAVFVGKTRLIDNCFLSSKEEFPLPDGTRMGEGQGEGDQMHSPRHIQNVKFGGNHMRTMLRGKIHRATVTGADLHYEGSVTIDVDLLERADILPYEQVDIWNVTNGERFTTYALAGQRGSGVVCINGAAAHKASKGDLVIIAAFAGVPEAEARAWTPRCVFVDSRNRPVELRSEHAGQADVTNAWTN